MCASKLFGNARVYQDAFDASEAIQGGFYLSPRPIFKDVDSGIGLQQIVDHLTPLLWYCEQTKSAKHLTKLRAVYVAMAAEADFVCCANYVSKVGTRADVRSLIAANPQFEDHKAMRQGASFGIVLGLGVVADVARAANVFEFIPDGVCVPADGQTLDEIAGKCMADAISAGEISFEYRITSQITPLPSVPAYCIEKAANSTDTVVLGNSPWYNKTAGDNDEYQMPPRSLVLVGLPKVTDGKFPCAVKAWLMAKAQSQTPKPVCSDPKNAGYQEILFKAEDSADDATAWELVFDPKTPVPAVSDSTKATTDLVFDYSECAQASKTANQTVSAYTRHAYDYTPKDKGDDGVIALLGTTHWAAPIAIAAILLAISGI